MKQREHPRHLHSAATDRSRLEQPGVRAALAYLGKLVIVTREHNRPRCCRSMEKVCATLA